MPRDVVGRPSVYEHAVGIRHRPRPKDLSGNAEQFLGKNILWHCRKKPAVQSRSSQQPPPQAPQPRRRVRRPTRLTASPDNNSSSIWSSDPDYQMLYRLSSKPGLPLHRTALNQYSCQRVLEPAARWFCVRMPRRRRIGRAASATLVGREHLEQGHQKQNITHGKTHRDAPDVCVRLVDAKRPPPPGAMGMPLPYSITQRARGRRRRAEHESCRRRVPGTGVVAVSSTKQPGCVRCSRRHRSLSGRPSVAEQSSPFAEGARSPGQVGL